MNSLPVVTVYIPQQLRNYTGGAIRVTIEGANVDEALIGLDRRFAGFRFRVVDEQNRIRQHMRIFIDDERVDAISAPLKPHSEMHILGALSGG